MTLKHTPGPWIHDYSEIIDGRGSRVCRFADYGAPWPEDMSVILAAPDMLRLLRVIVGTDDGSDDFPDNCFRWREAMREASELIARLDGDTCPGK